MTARRSFEVRADRWPLATPFRINGLVSDETETITVTLAEGAHRGRGEASGVYFRGETTDSMLTELEAARGEIEAGIDRQQLLRLLPAGGARNAVDCALWELESHMAGKPVWQLAGLPPPRPIRTAVSIGADAPETMARQARRFPGMTTLKLKLLGDGEDAERVRAVRRACPESWLGVDANQALDRDRLTALMPDLVAAGVAMIEQPVPVGEDASLEDVESPIPLYADESLAAGADLAALRRAYTGINIKLDKAGGLTAALALADEARGLGFELMVGNMLGTSLAMAPAWLVGQRCTVVDLDGPLLLTQDRKPAVSFHDGLIDCPPGVWGA